MRARLVVVVVAALVMVIGLVTLCWADAAEEGRKIVEANKEAVVTVQLVIETRYSGESEKDERKVSATGTVVDPSGLVVAALSQVDPTKVISEFMPDEDGGSKFQSNVVDVKFKTEDGTEIPADVVLRDPDLDLVFLRPKKAPETPMKFVDLSQAGSPQVMDEVVVLWRLGQVANRALAADVNRVQAVVTKPRLSYAVEARRLGCPVFSMDGKPVGLLVLRVTRGGGRGGGMYSAMDEFLTAVLPCAQVMKVAEQAKKAEPEKPAPEEKPAAKPEKKPAAKPPTKPAPKTK
jgi:S1-C subfamily serine protease